MPLQVTVSIETGTVESMFIWDENNPVMAAVETVAYGKWFVHLGANEGMPAEAVQDVFDRALGYYPTLHAALAALAAEPGAPTAEISTNVHGTVFVG